MFMNLKQKLTIPYSVALLACFFSLMLVVAKYIPAWSALPKWFERLLGADYYLHICVGFGLSLALAKLSGISVKTWARQLMFFMTLLLVYGIDELIQAWVPHRQFSVVDFAASATGWILALCAWFTVRAWRRPQGKVQLSE